MILENIFNLDYEVNRILKVVKFNFVVMKLLVGGYKKEFKVFFEFDFFVYKYFFVVKFV